ncbi:MAG TPA: hypothetical protein VFS10_20370 [Pyrinomonadaceae bacterium]|nr:hypothetical protein [Pyrinomonadaceae bacterium]
MLDASLLALQAQADQAYRAPAYFIPVALLLLSLGALGWLVAAVLGFTRARVFGASARWFALASVCLVIYHLQWVLLAVGIMDQGTDTVLSVGAFFNLFVVLAAICAIVGFTRFTNPRP